MINAPIDTEVYIYALCEPDPPHDVRYIGQTRHDPLWRYYMHRTGLKTPGKAAWLAALDEAHRHPQIRILEVVASEQADERERFHIVDHAQRGAKLLNILHNSAAPPTPPQERIPVYTALCIVRLKPRDKELLERIADERGIPASIVAREVIMDYLTHRSTATHTATTDDDTPT